MAGPAKTAAAAPASEPILALLKRNDGSGIPVFNQGYYPLKDTKDVTCNVPSPGDGTPFYDKTKGGKQRNIRTSGCGLCCVVSYLAAARCMSPQYDKASKTLTPSQNPTLIDPRTFIQYLQNYIDWQAQGDAAKKTTLIKNIFAPDGAGTLNQFSQELITAINELVTLRGLDAENVFNPGQRQAVPSPPGKEIKDVTTCIDGGYPAILGVSGTDAKTNEPFGHQVLAVGYLKSGGQTWYVIDDPGYPPMDPYPALSKMTTPINKSAVIGYTASTSRTNPINTISWFQPLQGLEQATGMVVTKNWTSQNAAAAW